MSTAAALLVLVTVARPDWVDGMPAAFPRDRFVVAVGAADERAAAELRARAGIAAFFESRVVAAAQVVETEARARRGGVELRVASVAARQEVTASSSKLLEGVEIADVWVDPEGRSHALAVLDRTRAIDVLRRRLADVDGEIAALAARLRQEKARFERARIAHRIVAAAARRPAVVADLRVIDPGAESPAPAAAEDARGAAEQALAAVGVAIRTTGDAAAPIAAAATRAVVATGMRAVAAGAVHDLSAAIDVEAAPPAIADGWTVVRLTARVRLVNTGLLDTMVTFVETVKGTSGRADEAARRAGEALAARVEERLHEDLRARLEAR
jgi:hypothetical protein